jgi:preprotein translocase subunit YajC
MKQLTAALITYFLGLNASLMAQPAEQPLPPPPDQGFMSTMVMLGVAFVFFYLILWRPEQKRRKELEAQRDTLKKGDRVTAVGIVGTVDRLKEQTVILRMVDGSKIEVVKAAINEVLPASEESDEEKKS